jgi:hypothetical protein
VQLGEAQDRLLEQVRRGVLLLVPGRVELGVVEAEVGAHVDHASPRLEPGGDPGRAHVVGEAGEDHVDALGVGLLDEHALPVDEREDGGVGLACERTRGELCKLHPGMPGQEVDERHARVAVGPRNRRLHTFHGA